MPLDFAKTVLQCGSELPIHKVLKQTLHDKGPAGLFTGMVRYSCSQKYYQSLWAEIVHEKFSDERLPKAWLLRHTLWEKVSKGLFTGNVGF